MICGSPGHTPPSAASTQKVLDPKGQSIPATTLLSEKVCIEFNLMVVIRILDLSIIVTGWRRDDILGDSRRSAATRSFVAVSYEKGD